MCETLSARQHRKSIIFHRHILVRIKTKCRINIFVVRTAKLEGQTVVDVVVVVEGRQALDGQKKKTCCSVQEGDGNHEQPEIAELVSK